MTQKFSLTVSDIHNAAAALQGVTVRTPLLENPDVNAMLGGRLLIKLESSQRTGAFKLRGAYWRMLNLSPAERKRGAITYSSGNHALGVARAAHILDSSALIIMPDDAPAAKVSAVKALGAEVTTFNRDRENYDDVVDRLAAETGRVHIPPSAHPQVLAGAGTVATELFEQAEALDARLDAVLIPCGGGGLTAATAVTSHELSAQTEVYAVEPEQFDDTRRSLEAGERLSNPKGRRSICDAIMTPSPNGVTFPINHALLAGGLVVSDDDVRDAMRFCFEHYKVVAEPGAAVGVAAVLSNKIGIESRTIATVVTGGNVDPDRFVALLRDDT